MEVTLNSPHELLVSCDDFGSQSAVVTLLDEEEVFWPEGGVAVPDENVRLTLVPEEQGSSVVSTQKNDFLAGWFATNIDDGSAGVSLLQELAPDGEQSGGWEVGEVEYVSAGFPSQLDVEHVFAFLHVGGDFGEDDAESGSQLEVDDDDGTAATVGDVGESKTVFVVVDDDVLETGLSGDEGFQVDDFDGESGLEVDSDDLGSATTNRLFEGVDQSDVQSPQVVDWVESDVDYVL